jgi:predicted nucleic acid-binding Zn ribbon protein
MVNTCKIQFKTNLDVCSIQVAEINKYQAVREKKSKFVFFIIIVVPSLFIQNPLS